MPFQKQDGFLDLEQAQLLPLPALKQCNESCAYFLKSWTAAPTGGCEAAQSHPDLEQE